MEELAQKLAAEIAEGVKELSLMEIVKYLDKFTRSAITVCFTEAEAAKLLNVEPKTLADYRRAKRINYYQFGRSATYGLHHLQDFLAKHEVKNAPSMFFVRKEVCLLGTESERKIRRVA